MSQYIGVCDKVVCCNYQVLLIRHSYQIVTVSNDETFPIAADNVRVSSLADPIFALKSAMQIFTCHFGFSSRVLLRVSYKLSLASGSFSLRLKVGHGNLLTCTSCFSRRFLELWACCSQMIWYFHASIQSPCLIMLLALQCCIRINLSEDNFGQFPSDAFLGIPWRPV